MLDLMRRLPPIHVEENVASLVAMCPDYADDLLGSVDQPLKVMTDRATGKEYLACDYNRDGDSYRYVRTALFICVRQSSARKPGRFTRPSERCLHCRLTRRSPWSNEYDPPLEDGTVPTPKLRKLEITANEAFDTYREMYVHTPSVPTTLHEAYGTGTARHRYYEGGVSSVFLWDLDDGGFAGVVLLKKSTRLS